MDQRILNQLERLEKLVASMATVMVTREQAKNFETKDDLKNSATKDDLKNLVTKDYLREQLKKQAETICDDLSESFNALFTKTDEIKADKKDVSALEVRVEKIER